MKNPETYEQYEYHKNIIQSTSIKIQISNLHTTKCHTVLLYDH